MNGENSRSAVAEFMAAITALKIAEDFFVDDITDFSAGYRSGSTTEQATEDRAGQTTKQHAGRTSDSTDCCAGLGTGQRSADTGCGTADRADSAANSSGGVEAINVGRMADGTLVTHGFFSWK
jgi:hypothetical protein